MASFPRSSPHSKPLLKQTPAQAQHPPRTGHACLMSGRRAEQAAIAFEYGADIEALLPKLRHPDYFTEPWLQELAARERAERGYCRRVCNFSVGRKGYGSVTFFGETDVRRLDLEGIVRFERREIVVYGDESCKPPAGQGLNKPAEVTLLNVRCIDKARGEHLSEGPELVNFEERLKKKTNEQGAEFVSYDAFSQEWKFRVKHFSRFGLDDSDDEEIPAVDDESHLVQSGMYNAEELELVGQDEDASGDNVSGRLAEISDMGSDEVGAEGSPMAEVQPSTAQTALPHTLPVHLRLDPVKMQQMKMLFFPAGEEAEDIALPRLWDGGPSRPVRMIAAEASGAVRKSPGSNIHRSAHAEDSSPKDIVSKRYKISPQASWQRSPARTTNNFGRQLIMGPHQGLSPNQSRVLLSIENKNEHFVPKRSRIGFKHEIGFESCVSGRTGNVSDASLFLGNSFRVGWGPHGLLVHSGRPVGQVGNVSGLSSIIHMERVSLDSTVRDESGKVREDLIELRFISPLRLHMSMSKIVNGIHEQYSGLRLRYLACNRMELSSVCNEYEDLIFNQKALEGLSGTQHLVLRHQGMVWDLLSVLFSDKLASSELHTEQDEDLDKADGATASLDTIDPEAKCYTRRAEFSRWLQHSVNNSVQVELVDLGVKDHLKEIFSLMTGRQLDDAVQIAASKGDVRLACLLSQAGGSMMNRKDIASQFDVWDQEGLDYSLIEKERIMLYKLLSGDIQGALSDREIDWKRFLGLLMWYHLAPDTELPDIINAYSQLVDEQLAPQPIPLYVEEGALNGVSGVNEKDFYDTSYYLMLLHASNGRGGFDVKKMFCSFSSTYDALDHEMAWFQRAFLEAIGVLSSSQLYVLDMNFVAQLLSVGQCHWAIYAILHMPPSLQYPGLHEKVVKEILNQYCDVWSTTDSQQSFLENELGVPIEWMHEALGIYWQYHGDSHKALDHYLKCHQWHKAHSLFVTSVAVSHFVNSQHADVLKFASHLEKHKAELDNWDLGGGIYIDFYTLKHSFQNDDITEELDSIEKGSACKEFFGRLKASRGLWANRSPEIRVVYSRMADELASLMLAESKANMLSRSTEMGLYDAVMDAPVPEDIRLCRLQGAVSVFTSWLSETASS